MSALPEVIIRQDRVRGIRALANLIFSNHQGLTESFPASNLNAIMYFIGLGVKTK
jgi:hypothetical protein